MEHQAIEAKDTKKLRGTLYIVGHPDQLKALYFLKPCKANDKMMNTATVWGIAVRSKGNVVPFHKRVFVRFDEEKETARVYRAKPGEEALVLLGSVPYEKARRFCEGYVVSADKGD